MTLCRDNEVSNIVELREAAPNLKVPRLLVIIDEFQKFFEVENDAISREAKSIIHTIIQEFRKFGINLMPSAVMVNFIFLNAWISAGRSGSWSWK